MRKRKRDSNKKGFLEGFKEFISKGSVIDLAIGVIIGAAFGAIVTSLVNDIIMPPIAAIFGDRGFSELYWVIAGADPASEAVISGQVRAGAVIYYGNFIQTVINFLIIAFVIYVVFVVIIKGAQKKLENLKEVPEDVAKPTPEPEPVIPEDVKLLTEIRDQLKDLKSGK